MFTALQAASVAALACRPPAESGVPISRWSAPELAREAGARGIATFLSASTVRRWLAQDALKPWQHRSWIFITDKAFPNTVMVHTPVHASWLNQVEIYFSFVQRKVVSPNDFTDLAQVGDRLRAFEARYNATAQPFQWKFTTSDLDDLPARLDLRTADHQAESSTAQAA